MDSNLTPSHMLCTVHPDEIVIRVDVSPDLNNPQTKLFYCLTCIEEAEPKPTKLIKFNDLLNTLHTEYKTHTTAEADVTQPNEAADPSIDQEQLQNELAQQISQQKRRVEEEFKKVAKQVSELLQNVKKAVHGRLDSVENSYKELMDEYSTLVESNQNNKIPSGEAFANAEVLRKRIFGDSSEAKGGKQGEATVETEKRLRSLLKEIKLYRKVKQGESLERITELNQKLTQTSKSWAKLFPEHNQDYSARIGALRGFLEAIVSALDGSKEDNEVAGEEPNSETERQKEVRT